MGNKKEHLLAFIREHRYVKTSDVVRWGIENFYISAERTARTLAQEGRIARLTNEEKQLMFPHSKREDVWQYISEGGEENAETRGV